MFFKSIIGQQSVKEKLLLSVQQNRVSHSQLFSGSEGNGALALALAFAQYINCENKSETDSCGTCSSCIKSQKMIHPDIHYSFPVYKLKSGSENPALSSDFIKQWREAVLANPYQNLNDWLDFINAENKQGNISAEECRVIIHNLNLKTFESKYKVMIIWMAEQLGKEGNILLKLLEEPSDNTLLILISENRDLLLSTILSRCQIVPVPRIADDDLLESLLQIHSLEREEAMKIIRHAEGNYREALRLIQHHEDDQPELLKRWMRLLSIEKNESELMNWIEEVARIGREKQKSFFRYALEFFRECVMLQQAGEQYSLLHEEEKKMALWLSQRLSIDDWQKLHQWFEEAQYQIERNAHPKILLTNLSIQIKHLIDSKKLSLAVSR
ncbi:MAG: ATP-binding protein [Chitinophagales bacterium]